MKNVFASHLIYRLRKAGLSVVFLIIVIYPLEAKDTEPGRKINIDNGWKFHFGHASDPERDFNYKIVNVFSKTGGIKGTAIDRDFDDTDWRALDLPHDWAVELPFVYSEDRNVMSHGYKPVGGRYPETSIGWYRKQIDFRNADSLKRYVLQFDGVFRDSKYWLNGHYLGGNESGYTGISFDITDFIDYTGKNILVVRVDASQYEGWFYEGAGIYRHVWLNIYDNLHLVSDGQFIYTETRGNKTHVYIENKLENKYQELKTVTLQNHISGRDGKIISSGPEKKLEIDSYKFSIDKDSIVFDDALLWSIEEPYLYRLITEVRLNGRIIDRLKTPFGVRTIEVDPRKGLLLNGKNIKIHGVNCHQDHAGVGSALPDYLQYYRIRLLKEFGVNAYRASHNPPSPELLDACDSLGVLVMDETRLFNSGPESMDQFRRLVRRDRNHPCVFMWSIGNEEAWVQETITGKRIALSVLAELKSLDPTRTATYAADLPDIFTGVNEVIPVRGFNYRIFAIDDYHTAHPDQPVIGTEMGSTVTTRGIYETDSVNCYLPDQDLNAPWWASLAEYWWTIAAEREWFMGGFIWTGFDYRGEPTPFHWPNINSHFGIMDMCGFPKNLYYYYQSWWTDKDVLHISPHWNWQGREGDTVDVWINTNAREVELILNDRSLGTKKMNVNSHLRWEVAYHPGTLKAKAVKDGRVLTEEISTTGKPVKVVAIPDRNTIAADGKDVTVVNIHVEDEAGRPVPDAGDLIEINVEGPARIIGVGNGDPSCHEPDKIIIGEYRRSLFNGKCQAIIQSTGEPGIITFTARSDSLVSGIVTVNSIE